MPNGHRVELTKLVTRVHALSDSIAGIGTVREWRELLQIIRRPGWTTPAEFRYALGIVEAMIAQARALRQLKVALMRASRSVATRVR